MNNFWLQSLQETAFDVFMVTIVLFAIIIYHYLKRWYDAIKYKKTKEKLNEIYYKVCDIQERVKLLEARTPAVTPAAKTEAELEKD
tara:strand:- start:799 stop:1056 length:258 start_codon:yes stop_codon:yes gene_type:complete